jgi:hypothetical protein
MGIGIGMRLGDCFSSPVVGFLCTGFVSSIVLVLVLSAAVLVLEMSDVRFRDGLQAGNACRCFATRMGRWDRVPRTTSEAIAWHCFAIESQETAGDFVVTG